VAIQIKSILQRMIELEASDLHLKVGLPPSARVHGQLIRLDFPAPTPRDMTDVVQHVLTPAQREQFETTREVDFAFGVPGLARFRANFYVQRGSVAMVYRQVPVDIQPLGELALPPVVRDIAMKPRGLVLVTGTVGSGKSTTLAGMIDAINESTERNIITIEDPIEFLHRDKKSIINQREVGNDTASFFESLRHILRQDPDVILIGEIRDAETMKTALTAADTGHLVFSTLHTLDAAQTIHRILSFFPPHQHEEIRFLLANTLKAIISQRLIPTTDGKGRVAAAEIMVSTSTIEEYIRDPKRTHMITDAIADGNVTYQMQTFDQALMQLFRQNRISLEQALHACTNPNEFKLRVKGIVGASDGRWDQFESEDGEPSGEVEAAPLGPEDGFVKL
jgi:twitching motility protein PilT